MQYLQQTTPLQPIVLWLTGLSGAGKTTIAKLVAEGLNASGRPAVLLDADELRAGLNSDLGFSDSDRAENIRRIAEVANLFSKAGIVAVVACISPLREHRQGCRRIFGSERFIEIFVDTALPECMRRDPKGLYEKALRGEITNFTGLHSRYEPPDNPDIHIHTENVDPKKNANDIMEYVNSHAS